MKDYAKLWDEGRFSVIIEITLRQFYNRDLVANQTLGKITRF